MSKALLALAVTSAGVIASPVVASADDVSTQAVTCETTKNKRNGRIDCTGSGEVRIVVDCTAPQITDWIGEYVRFTGSVRLYGYCNFGVNSVSYQARA